MKYFLGDPDEDGGIQREPISDEQLLKGFAKKRLINRDLLWAPGTEELTEAQLNAIRTRHNYAIRPIPSKTALGYDHLMADADRGALLGELDRTRAKLQAAQQGRTNYAVPPGAYLEEWIEEQGSSLQQVADLLGYPLERVNEILDGSTPVTLGTAIRLERVVGIPADSWLRYETAYRADLNRLGNQQEGPRAPCDHR